MKILCPHCENEPLKLFQDYKGVKCYVAWCEDCDFQWLPIEEENRIDAEIAKKKDSLAES